MDSIRFTVSENLRRVCKLKKIKSKDIAQHLGVSTSAVSHWFKCDNSIDMDNLYKICQFIGVSMDQVFGLDPIVVGVLSVEENDILVAYRNAGEETRENIRRILQPVEIKKDSGNAAI